MKTVTFILPPARRLKAGFTGILLMLLTALCMQSCTKDAATANVAHVKIQIDYLGSGGYYNDNMGGVPQGLVIGTNGPFDVDAGKTYTLQYLPDSRWTSPATVNFSPGAGITWIVHCYVSGNTGTIEYHTQ